MKILTSFKDVRNKARTIFLEDRIDFLKALPAHVRDFSKVSYIEAAVQGDNDVYVSKIMLRKGSKAIASWSCTCPWYTYVWDRSPGYKHLEGRLCSHALALYYFYQSGRLKQEWEKWRPEVKLPKAAKDISDIGDMEFFDKVQDEHKQYQVEGARARNIDNIVERKAVQFAQMTPEELVNLLERLFV